MNLRHIYFNPNHVVLLPKPNLPNCSGAQNKKKGFMTAVSPTQQ